MDDIKNAKHFQELTFETLSKYIESEAKKGNSKWYIPNGMSMGEQMADVLREKGFAVYIGNNISSISW